MSNRHKFIHVIGVILLAISLPITAFAIPAGQENFIGYRQTIGGSISQASPTADFFFQGSPGDLVDIRLFVFVPGQDFVLSVYSPSGALISTIDQAQLSLRLAETGIFTIQVSSPSSQTGEFLLQVYGNPPAAPIQALAPGSATTLTFPGAPAELSISADPSAPQSITISAAEGFRFDVVIVNNLGKIVFTASDLPSVAATLPPAAESVTSYEVRVSASDSNATGAVQIDLAAEASALSDGSGSVPSPVTTLEVLPPGEGICIVTANTVVNVRQGPTTAYFIAGQLLPGVSVPVIGINQDWYAISFNDAVGWVSGTVTTPSGECSTVPFMNAEGTPSVVPTIPATASATATSTYTPTATPTTQQATAMATATSTIVATSVSPTSTFTPTLTQTVTPAQSLPSPTLTVSAPTAPPDANYSLTIPLDGFASVTDFVSYPGGDTTDEVSYNVSGMNSNPAVSGGRARLILSVSCFGTGTQNLVFSIGGQSFSCGQTIFDQEVTADSNSGSVQISATAGNNIYAQWVLTGTATRLN